VVGFKTFINFRKQKRGVRHKLGEPVMKKNDSGTSFPKENRPRKAHKFEKENNILNSLEGRGRPAEIGAGVPVEKGFFKRKWEKEKDKKKMTRAATREKEEKENSLRRRDLVIRASEA